MGSKHASAWGLWTSEVSLSSLVSLSFIKLMCYPLGLGELVRFHISFLNVVSICCFPSRVTWPLSWTTGFGRCNLLNQYYLFASIFIILGLRRGSRCASWLKFRQALSFFFSSSGTQSNSWCCCRVSDELQLFVWPTLSMSITQLFGILSLSFLMAAISFSPFQVNYSPRWLEELVCLEAFVWL